MRRTVAAAVAVAFVVLAAPARPAAGERIDVKNLPASVVKAIQGRFPGAELLRAERERDDGKVEYEVKFRHRGVRWEAEVTEDGRIKEVERDD